MDRERMIDTIIDDLEGWLERDAYGFWDHIRDVEREYLKKKGDEELDELVAQSV